MELIFVMYAALITSASMNLIEAAGDTGCYYNGQPYLENSIIEETGCFAVVCTSESRIEYLVDENCKSDVARKSFQETLMLAVKRGNGESCVYKGITYQPGAEISSFYDEISGYCYGRLCVSDDETILWARPSCDPTQVRSTETNNLREIVAKLKENYYTKLYERVKALLYHNAQPNMENSQRGNPMFSNYFLLASPPKRANLKPK